MSQKRPHEDVTPSDTYNMHPVYISNAIHDRSSKFIALFSPTTTNPSQFQSYPPFSTAMHRVLAWRKRGRQSVIATGRGNGVAKTLYETGFDDDGESHSGRRVVKVMEEMGVEGTVVMARWFGGTMLGPVRFKWMEDVSREAIMMSRQDGVGSDGGKRVKTDETGDVVDEVVDEAKEKARLVRVLEERDASVTVLRELLTSKQEELKELQQEDEKRREEAEVDGEASGNVQQQGTITANQNGEKTGNGKDVDAPDVSNKDGDGSAAKPAQKTLAAPARPPVDYGLMPLARLKQLEKARDATLGWILKSIDGVEVQLKGKERERKREQEKTLEGESKE